MFALLLQQKGAHGEAWAFAFKKARPPLITALPPDGRRPAMKAVSNSEWKDFASVVSWSSSCSHTEPRAVATGSNIQFAMIAVLARVECWIRSLPLAVL